MACEREIFSSAGPFHLTSVDWENPDHRRSVAASLVEGAYDLEYDRQQNRQGSQVHACPWWGFFGFRLIRLLVDPDDSSIFGAIYEFNPTTFNIPRYVIAFRGTTVGPGSMLQDVKLNLKSGLHKLHQSRRFAVAVGAIRHMTVHAGAGSVWLAGHSLGSAIAMLAGKNMAKSGYLIETYLFNPPFLSPSIEWIKNGRVKKAVRVTKSVVKAGVASVSKSRDRRTEENNRFVQLSSWVPYLFVNPADHICSEYIGYFENRNIMERLGMGKIERLATQNSTANLLSAPCGGDSEPLHLLPSADLNVNQTPSGNFRQAHGINQWWAPNLHCWPKRYLFNYARMN